MTTMADILPLMLKENAAAIAFNMAVYQIVEIWDDLIDKDKPASCHDIDGAFYAALITLPRNGFYRENFALLNPILESAILDWWAANKIEDTQKGDDLKTSYILRCGFQSLTTMSARIIGGVEWAQKVNTYLRTHGDTWAEYSAEFEVK